MQGIIPPSTVQLLAAGQQMLSKLEIYTGDVWLPLCVAMIIPHCGDVADNWAAATDADKFYAYVGDCTTQTFVSDGAPLKIVHRCGIECIEGINLSLGGASMTPAPVGGTWGATLFNEGSLYHPKHPASPYIDYLKTGRTIRLSLGATYAGVDYYWPRLTGYIDEPTFDMPSFKVNISGADYMKALQDVELRSPDTLWRQEETFDSIADDGRGVTEYYEEDDAMDIPDEANNVTPWIDTMCTISSELGATEQGDTTDGSPIITGMADTSDFFLGVHVQISAGFPPGNHKVLEITANSITLDVDATATVADVTVKYYVAKVITTDTDPPVPTARNENIFVPVNGQKYIFNFHWMAGQASGDYMRVRILQHNGGWHELARIEGLGGKQIWTEESIVFVAQSVDPIQIWIEFYDVGIGRIWYLDLFTIRKYTSPDERYYELQEPVAPCNGIYRVLLDEGEGAGFEDVWQGEEDSGYFYTEEEEFGPDPPAHPPKIVWFDKNRKMKNGTNNLKIQYFITVPLENMVADILVTAGLYANRAAAIDAMDDHPDYADPNIDIDQCWFEVGESALSAIRMICERANYRFFFTYEGKPAFIPAPAPVGVSFAFTAQSHIASVHNYQDKNEIWNRIIIEGSKRADPVNLEEARSSEFIGERHNQDSIDAYGERTLTIKNHLFQDDDSINHAVTGMCAILLAEYKDPKCYADIEVPYNPVPLELGDKITWLERLSPVLEITQTGIIRDIKISTFFTTYKCVIV